MRYRLGPELAAVSAAMPSGQLARLSIADIVAGRAQSRAAVLAAGLAGDARVRWWDATCPGLTGAAPVPLRIYQPTEPSDTPRPALLFMHGGAFLAGDLDSEHARLVGVAAEFGGVVVSVEYRLAPEHPYPAGLDDCMAALAWTSAEAADLGLDPGRLAVGGASAGGCLAAAVALRARDEGGPPIRFQFLLYPCLDDRRRTRSNLDMPDAPIVNAADGEAIWRLYLGEQAASAGAPIYAAPSRVDDLSGLPAVYIMTAEYDVLRDEAIDYAARLLSAGVSVELHNVARAIHGFDVLCDNPLGRWALSRQHEALVRGLAPVQDTGHP